MRVECRAELGAVINMNIMKHLSSARRAWRLRDQRACERRVDACGRMHIVHDPLKVAFLSTQQSGFNFASANRSPVAPDQSPNM